MMQRGRSVSELSPERGRKAAFEVAASLSPERSAMLAELNDVVEYESPMPLVENGISSRLIALAGAGVGKRSVETAADVYLPL